MTVIVINIDVISIAILTLIAHCCTAGYYFLCTFTSLSLSIPKNVDHDWWCLLTAQRRAWLEPERSQSAGRPIDVMAHDLIELMVDELVDGSCQTFYYQQVSPISAMFSIAASEVLHCHCNCLHSHLKGAGHRCERPKVGTAAQVRGWCWAGFGIWNGTWAVLKPSWHWIPGTLVGQGLDELPGTNKPGIVSR